MHLIGKNGVLRIFDSADVLHGVAPRDEATVDMVHFDGVSTYTNQTTNLEADDANIANNLLADNNDRIYIGSDVPFLRVQFVKGGGSDYAAGSGALKVYYFNGTDFNSTVSGVSDGTLSGSDCFGADGIISFKAPADWATGADSFNANLDSDKFYIYFQMTTSSAPDADVDVLCPVDGQYFEVAFSNMDFNGPIGRKRPEEILVLNRNTFDAKAHYINTSDIGLYEPIPISFSCLVDSIHNNQGIINALACGNAQVTLESDLITNGSFGSGIGDWDDNSTGDGSFAWDTNHAELDANTGTAEMGQTITLVSGGLYRLRFDIAENCTSLLVTGGTSAYGGTEHFTQTFTATGNNNDIVFEAAGTSLYLEFKNSTNEIVSLDDIELYRVTAPRWNATGTSSKATTQNDGSVDNPAFADSNKKTVNVMILFSSPGSGLDFGWAFYETFFLASEVSFAEGEEGHTFQRPPFFAGLLFSQISHR